MSIYESNLNCLYQKNPAFSAHINTYQENSRYEIFIDTNVDSLNLVDTKTYKPLYQTAPQTEVSAQKKAFEKYREYPYLYFFGLGNGVLLSHLLQNPQHRRIVVIEPDVEIAYIILNMIDFSQAILEERLVFLEPEQVDFPRAVDLFKEMDEHRYARVYDLHIMTPFYDIYEEQMHKNNQIILETLHHMIKSSGNDAIDALIGMKHHFANLPTLIKTPTFVNLVKKAKTTDLAILVSAGPSLAKHLALLKEAAPYVTIFAVDAVFPILTKNGIKPDVIFSIERVEATANFFEQTPQEAYEDVVIALSSLQHEEVVKSIKGGTMQMSMRPFGFMELTGPKEWGFVGIGMSSANMAYETIYHAGFKTCVLIGQDLAYGKDGSSHSAGHIFGADEVKHSTGDIWIEGYGGEERVKTNEVWTLFRKFFEKDVDAAKIRMQTVNATEGGARIYGTLEQPFKDVVAPFLKKKQRKETIRLDHLSKDIQEMVSLQTKEKIKQVETYVLERKEEVEALFLDVAKTCERLDAQQELKNEEFDALFARIKKVRDYIDDEYFEGIIWNIAQSMLMVQELDLAVIEVQAVNSADEQHQKMIDLIRGYKVWLFGLAGSINAILSAINMGQEMSIEFDQITQVKVYADGKGMDILHVNHEDLFMKNIADIKQMCINYILDEKSITSADSMRFYYSDEANSFEAKVHIPTKNDGHFNEFAFKNSLQITHTEINNKYQKNVVCFYGSDENLDDIHLIQYIFSLLQRYPEITLQVICYENNKNIYDIFSSHRDRIRCITPTSLETLANFGGVYISTRKNNKIDNDIFHLLTMYSKIAMVYYVHDLINLQIGDGVVPNHPLILYPEYFGYSKEDIDRVDSNIYKLLFEEVSPNMKSTDSLYELIYDKVMYKLLQDEQFKNKYVNYSQLEEKYSIWGHLCKP